MPATNEADDLRDIYLFTGRIVKGADELVRIPFQVYARNEVATPAAVKPLLAAGSVFGELPPVPDKVAKVTTRTFFVNLAALDPPGAPSNIAVPAAGKVKPTKGGKAGGGVALYVRRDDAKRRATTVCAVPWSVVDSKECPRVSEPGPRGRMMFFHEFGVVVANLLVSEPIAGLTCYLVNLTSLRSVGGGTRTKSGLRTGSTGGSK